MRRSVFTKTIWERSPGLVWWAVGLVSLAVLTVAFYPSVREGADVFDQLLDQIPEGLLSLFGVDDQVLLTSPVGFINSRLYSSIGAVVIVIYGISLGTQAVAGEEDRRTMDLLLSQPLTRSRLVIEKFLAMAVLVAVLAVALFLVLIVSNPIVDLELTLAGMVAANVGVILLALVFGSFALALGALTGRRALTLGVAAGVTVATFFINGLAPLVDSIRWSRRLSPFHWFSGSNPLANGFGSGFLVMAAFVVVAVAVAVWGFRRRDVLA